VAVDRVGVGEADLHVADVEAVVERLEAGLAAMGAAGPAGLGGDGGAGKHAEAGQAGGHTAGDNGKEALSHWGSLLGKGIWGSP